MKQFIIREELEYVHGYLRYGHLETTIEAETEEEALKIYKEHNDYDDLIIDDYSVEDWEKDSNSNPVVAKVIEGEK